MSSPPSTYETYVSKYQDLLFLRVKQEYQHQCRVFSKLLSTKKEPMKRTVIYFKYVVLHKTLRFSKIQIEKGQLLKTSENSIQYGLASPSPYSLSTVIVYYIDLPYKQNSKEHGSNKQTKNIKPIDYNSAFITSLFFETIAPMRTPQREYLLDTESQRITLSSRPLMCMQE